MNRTILLFFAFVILYSCKKDSDNSVPDSQFSYNGKSYKTPNGLYMDEKYGENHQYTIYFYSQDISYSYIDTTFYGQEGQIMGLTLNGSLFLNANLEPTLDNIETGTSLDVMSGRLLLVYRDRQEEEKIDSGTLKVDIANNNYFFDYKIMLHNGTEISGNFSGALLISVYNNQKIALLKL